MNFDVSEDQRMIQDSVNRLMADRYTFELRRRYQQEAGGWSRALWRQYAQLGLLGLPFHEDNGGLSGTPVETMIVMEAFGRALALEPFLGTVILAGGLLRHAANSAQRDAIIPRIIAGDMTLALAHHERDARYERAHVETTASRSGDGWVLQGRKDWVLQGGSVDQLIVSARTRGAVRDRVGIGLFLVDAKSDGIARHGYPTQDGLQSATVTLEGVRVGAENAIGDPSGGYGVLARVLDEATAAICAEAVGAMGALHALTVDYLKQRKQFGVAIGSFQALQHRAVDMLMSLEQARSMSLFATMMVASDDVGERSRAMSAAKVQIGRSGRHIGEQAIQLHGGIGMTMEYKAGHYFKRLTMLDVMLGDSDHHLGELGEAGGLFRD